MMYTLKKIDLPEPAIRVKYCDKFWGKFVGLMFSKELEPDAGIVLADSVESKLNSAIHMFFMNYDITALWLDKDLVIVDKALAKRWRPYYAPQKPAQYVVELHASRFSDFKVGEKLVLLAEN
ncbi:MAG: DUF192 domain-containing protein [Anaerolineaceae bacterium]|nr:DUF192 domain-containing protein [Anaerolineaceae bacterium]